MKKSKTYYITSAALVAALYVILTYLSSLFGLDKMAVQCRISEALCILPFFMPSSVIGLFIGCFLANMLCGAMIWDVIFGSVATLIGALIASKIKIKWLVPLPTIIANIIIVPPVLIFAYGVEQAYYLILIGVLAGEVISCYVLGIPLLLALEKHKSIFR